MSEPVLKAILRLFAIVAKDGDVTQQERDHILAFLTDHLGRKSVMEHMAFFDTYSEDLGDRTGKQVEALCEEINLEVTQKQKAVILLELMSVVLADGVITEQERRYVRTIGNSLNVGNKEIDLITHFILGLVRHEFDSESILIIDAVKDRPGSCKHIYREKLQGMIAILHLAAGDLYFFKYIGNEDVYLNGVPQRSTNISPLARGSSIRWEGSNLRWEGLEPVYFGEILGQFKKPGSTARTTFEARNISYQFKNGRLGLREVSLAEESGNLIALMGASGAGKSTLLHVLNGTERPSSGQVLLNSIDIHSNPEEVEGVFGFVPQDDLLMEDLTVYQNLYFAGKLCFDNLSETDLTELVLKTISDLGLSEIKDLKVGSPLRKTISGGQRKRLNIGLELLREPSVLFLDEPTSGLSSRDSENIIELLKELALKGKLVFAVIHQPSSDIFKMFDRLVILDTGGYQIYYGNPVDAITFFKQNINLINSDQGECPECGNVNPEQIFNIIETKVLDEFGNFTHERKISPEQWTGFYHERMKPSSFTSSSEKPVSSLHRPGWLKQMKLFGLRDSLSKLGNRQYLAINLLEAPLLAFILAFITYYYNVDDPTQTGYALLRNVNVPAYLFMSVIVALFMGLTVSAEEIIRDRKILKREAFLHLSRGSYLSSKVAILFTMSAIQTLLFVVVGHAVLHIEGLLLTHWAILFTTSCFANMVGLNISSAFNSAVTIYILIPILLIPQLILSGVVVKFDKLNPVIGNQETVPLVGDFMASRWAFEAAMVSQFKDNRYEREFYSMDKTIAESDFKNIYYLPSLQSKLEYARLKAGQPEEKAKVAESLKLLQRELNVELESVGKQNFPEVSQLTVETFDTAIFRKTRHFLMRLRQFYTNESADAAQQRDKKMQALKKLYGGEKEYEAFRLANQNEAVAVLVKNLEEPVRIIESQGRLVQKIYPIYKDPDPEHFIDFDAQFYLPAKHFLRASVDTAYFNMAVIWCMSLILYISLYFDVLRRLMSVSFRK